MSSATPPSPIREIDYDALESALTQTYRGRWFLAEYLRRNQPAEFASLREALKKIEKAVASPAPAGAVDGLRHDLIEMSEAIVRTRREIAAIKPADQSDSQLMSATGELDAIVDATERATSDILEAAEDIQEVAWLLREKGIEEVACDRLDGRATEIYTSCSFQDITGQRIQKVVNVLRFLESRVTAMIKIWGLEQSGDDELVDDAAEGDSRPDAHLLNGPQREGEGLAQGAIDEMIDATPVAAASEPETVSPAMAAAEAQAADELLSEQSIDALMAEPGSTDTPPDPPEVQAESEPANAAEEPCGGELEVEALGPTKAQALFS